MLLTVAFRYTGIALQFAILMAVARNLSAHDYGKYVFVLSAVLPTYFILGMGASETFVREAPRLVSAAERRTVSAFAGGTLSLAVACAALLVGATGISVSAFSIPGDTEQTLWFACTFFIANGIMFNGAQLLLGVGASRLGAFFFYPALNVSLLVSTVPYALLVAEPSFRGLALVTSVASSVAASLAVVLVLVRVRPAWATTTVLRRLTGTGIKLALARALYSLGLWLPTLVAGFCLSATQAGYLGTAGRLAVAVAAVGAAIRFAVRPAIVRAYASGDHAEIKRICGTLASSSLVVGVIAIALNAAVGHRVITWLFGPGFAPVAPLLTILLFAFLAEAFGGPVDEVLKMTGHENRVLVILGVAVPILALALVGASQLGMSAMAAVQVVYSSAVFAAMIWSTKRVLGIWLHPLVPQAIRARLQPFG